MRVLKDVVHMWKKIGPRTEPWGTPQEGDREVPLVPGKPSTQLLRGLVIKMTNIQEINLGDKIVIDNQVIPINLIITSQTLVLLG